MIPKGKAFWDNIAAVDTTDMYSFFSITQSRLRFDNVSGKNSLCSLSFHRHSSALHRSWITHL